MYAHFYSNNAKVVQNILTVIGEKRHIENKKKKIAKQGSGVIYRLPVLPVILFSSEQDNNILLHYSSNFDRSDKSLYDRK